MLPLFDVAVLEARAREAAGTYRSASPTPHCCLDGLADPAVLATLIAEFPPPDHRSWNQLDSAFERKLSTGALDLLPDVFQQALEAFNHRHFLRFLEQLTGIQGLVPDPYFVGGGLSSLRRGGWLDVHCDFNYHPMTRLDRRLNVLFYLNEAWPESYGGHFELWDAELTGCQQRYLPLAGRMVVFDTIDTAYHGNPTPVACPEERSRNSIAIYYYSNGRPEPERSRPHSTYFPRLPGEPPDAEREALRRRFHQAARAPADAGVERQYPMPVADLGAAAAHLPLGPALQREEDDDR
jgi:hypothetical protein